MLKIIIKNSWQDVLQDEFQKDYYQHLRQYLKNEYATQTIYPDMYHIFEALQLTPFEEVKVVILGQDPYHGPNQAHGLSFSVQPGVRIPPSLRNIYQELQNDLGIQPANHGCLTSWAKQGVLLLNTVLTVRAGQANSHASQGWEILTDEIIKKLNARPEPMVFILWGRHAQKKIEFIDTSRHVVIQSPHPSPFSANRGFFGSRPFSRCNQALVKMGYQPINWQLPPVEQLKNF